VPPEFGVKVVVAVGHIWSFPSIAIAGRGNTVIGSVAFE
jgi:hypothetical protein